MVDKNVYTDWIAAFDAIEEDCYYECDHWYESHYYDYYNDHLEVQTLLKMDFGEVLSNTNLGL